MANTIFPRRSLAALAAALAIVLGACGTSTTSPSAPAASDAPASVAPGGSPAASGGYTGPAASIEYSIWGDPAEIDSQTKLVESFEAVNPTIDVKVSVADWDSYWEKLLTGLAGGAAPDVFAMDGPLFPDYQARDVLLDLQPLIERDGYDLSQLADQGVGVFKTAEGAQFGLPRDLNVVALYYNKKMFDAAGVPYPDDTWDWAKLVEVGKQLTLDTNSDGTTDQWGLYTETSDMENYWLSLVWQNGGDFFAADGKSTALTTDQSAGGIQFLQDLIYKEKILAEPAIFADLGDAFEQGLAAMEVNGSWLVPTHQAAGIDLGIAPIPSGPSGRFTTVNPTGAVVYKGTKAPDAAWEFVKYLASPPAQEQLMQLKASLPVSKEVLAGPYATSFDGAQVFADSLAYAKAKPSFAGYEEYTGILQTELDENVFNANNKTAKEAVDTVAPELDALLATERTEVSRSIAPGPPISTPRSTGRLGRDSWWAWWFLAPTHPGAGRAVGRPHLRVIRDQPDRLGPALSGQVRRPRQLRGAARRRPLPARVAQHGLLHGDLGAARADPRAGPCPRARPTDPRHRHHPDRVLPPGRHLDHGHRAGLAVDLQPPGRPAQCGAWHARDPGTEVGERPVLVHAVDRLHERLAGPRGHGDHPAGRAPGHPAAVLRRGGRGRRRAVGPVPSRDPPAADADPLLHRDPRVHRGVPGLRPGLCPGSPG